MALLHRLPALLVTLSLLLGAALPAGGLAVLCFGADHVAVEAAAGPAGPGGHCGDHGEPDLAAADPGCSDLTPAAHPLDRAGAATTLAPAQPLAFAWVPPGLPVCTPVGGAWTHRSPRPPPHLVSIDTLVLRL